MSRIRLIFAMLLVAVLAAGAQAQNVSLTPAPKSMTAGSGEFTLRHGLNVCTDGLPADMAAEASKFVALLNKATGLDATASASAGDITVKVDSQLAPEGYTLDITPAGIEIKASAPAGLFYAFQTIRKLLPANVMVGVSRPDLSYALPVVAIADEPRYGYRGFMLDVSRHFFDADEVKKMIDIMAAYKLNRFHWHLTDDQGWRLPVEKYPLLTTVGATNQNIQRTDFADRRKWRDGRNVPYGPYAYTADEIRDIVAYARDRHIEIIPEIDMPGHMVAAIHAYPNMSTDPESKLVPDSIAMDSEPIGNNPYSHFTHNMWNIGGVSRDVLDISNPEVMTFVKDVVDQLAEFFPYEYIHVGGDECPTMAWELSESCQKLKNDLGLENERALQSWFTKEIADYAKAKHGKKIMGWNELITDEGADLETLKTFDPIIFCWYPAEAAAKMAGEKGFKHVYTPFNGGYYINRSYKGIDRFGAGGDGAVEVTYNVNAPESDNLIGVQGTFWTEHVSRATDLEYLALPRLIGIAEQGWSFPESKNYDDFMKRLRDEAVMLDLGGYNYGHHQIR